MGEMQNETREGDDGRWVRSLNPFARRRLDLGSGKLSKPGSISAKRQRGVSDLTSQISHVISSSACIAHAAT